MEQERKLLAAIFVLLHILNKHRNKGCLPRTKRRLLRLLTVKFLLKTDVGRGSFRRQKIWFSETTIESTLHAFYVNNKHKTQSQHYYEKNSFHINETSVNVT